MIAIAVVWDVLHIVSLLHAKPIYGLATSQSNFPSPKSCTLDGQRVITVIKIKIRNNGPADTYHDNDNNHLRVGGFRGRGDTGGQAPVPAEKITLK